MTQREYRFELSNGETYAVSANDKNAAFETFKASVFADEVPNETVIGLDVDSPKFWIKRGGTLYPISAMAAAVASH